MEGGAPVTIITGASAGIGTELARVFARHGHGLLLVARREDKLKALADEIAGAGLARPHVLGFDLGRPDAVERVAAELATKALAPQYLVNNAGFGLVGDAATTNRAQQLAMIDLNVRALTDLSLAFVDALARHRGGIMNVASVAGFQPGPGHAVYYATKAFVLSFTEALHFELAPRGVRVTALCPGPVPTEFQARAGVAKSAAEPAVLVVPATRVAEEGYRGLMQGRRLVVPGAGNKVLTMLPRLLPRSMVLALTGRRQRQRLLRHPPTA